MGLKKQGWGLSWGGESMRARASPVGREKEDCQLNGGKVLGSIIMEITYPRAFFLLLTTCSFHIGAAHREASF